MIPKLSRRVSIKTSKTRAACRKRGAWHRHTDSTCAPPSRALHPHERRQERRPRPDYERLRFPRHAAPTHPLEPTASRSPRTPGTRTHLAPLPSGSRPAPPGGRPREPWQCDHNLVPQPRFEDPSRFQDFPLSVYPISCHGATLQDLIWSARRTEELSHLIPPHPIPRM